MKGVLGLIFSNMHDHMVSELTTHRSMGSIPIGGRYRLIDFVLSSFVNSGIQDVGIITKSNYQSLMDHLGTGREWDLTRKRGGLIILPPFGRAEANGMYRGRVEALAGIMGYIKGSSADYVLSADCDMMANIDFNGFMRAHIKSKADISVMYKRMEVGEIAAADTITFQADENGNVSDMLISPDVKGEHNVFINIMMMSRDFLERVVNDCYSRNLMSFNKDVLQAGIGKHSIHAYEYKGYVSRIDSMRTYYSANMALLDSKAREVLFPQDMPIYTKIRDDAPVRYGLDAKVENSLVADGCVIEGEVENSLIFRGVNIGKGAKIKNSIIMQGTEVGAGSNLEYVITDKDCTVKGGRMIMGFETYPVYIAKGTTV